LEYYSGRAVGCAGWMDTVSKALPLLFKYNYGLLFNPIICFLFREFEMNL